MKTIEYDPNSYNTALDELVTALRTGDKVTVIPVDPYRELRKAQDEGKHIECLQPNGSWKTPSAPLKFINPPENYRIKPDTVKMWQWVYRIANGEIRLSPYFFQNEEEVSAAYESSTILQRADWTEIEVEKN